MFEMHDWTLQTVQYEWESARAVFIFVASKPPMNILVAQGVTDIHIPHKNEWGPSVSVNKVGGPVSANNGKQTLTIEMQSGDTITVTAASFVLEKA